MIISLAVVAYNESETLPRLFECIKSQDYPHEKMEILLIDSMSSDNTWELMQDFADNNKDFRNVKLLKNLGKILPCGCNEMIENFEGDAVTRIDGHAEIPNDFISKNVKYLEKGEYVVGGQRPNIIDEHTPWKETLLIVEQSMFGSSIASYRRKPEGRYVKSVFHGMYKKEVYDATGPYNEDLARTEDNDMSQRIREIGFKIFFAPEIISYQHTRNTLKKMLQQKYKNGLWAAKTLGVNSKAMEIYHFVPFAFVLGIILTTILALCKFPLLAIIMWIAYGALIVLFTVLEMTQRKFSATNLLLPILFLLLHLSYGVGSLVGFIQLPFWLKKIKDEC